MLGHSHAVSGALAWAATATVLPEFGGVALGPRDILVGTLLTAGAALVPDLDHPDSTIANFLGPPSELLARVVSFLSGGHRHGTHSLLFIALAWLGTWAGVAYLGRNFVLVTVFILLALAIRALHLCPPGNGVKVYGTIGTLSLVGTFAVANWLPGVWDWLPWSMAIGCAAHILGDCLTDRGCPLLWPVKGRFGIPVVSRTGNAVETWVLVPLMTVATLALLWFTTAAPAAIQAVGY
ncbi:metal-dependent hydrolase [Carbonactinospora thermoautotrophica]|uniref:metal-dependent hydrolase n=1 Tax=Carbonactinospora thermoautotrophica TaxID=1469144 RepID=UPI0022710B9C|nr:metal-dependent hydrolase [Carbonactinospora thermoautotrophica]MCX9191354.1 metal-dependent hydrolase [Carbonactinospora thermoautotrophica]